MTSEPNPLASRPTREPGVVCFNGNGELACAVLIIDLFLSPLHKYYESLAERLLRRFFKLVPDYPPLKPRNAYSTLAQCMQTWCIQQIKPQTIVEFIEWMALTIKHLVVEHIFKHPHQYQSLFINTNEAFTNPSTATHVTALNPWIAHALAESKLIAINVFETKEEKQIAKRHTWPDATEEPRKLFMHWHNNTCELSAYVEFSSAFNILHLTPPNTTPFCLSTASAYAAQAQAIKTSLIQYNLMLTEMYQSTLSRLHKFIKKNNVSEQTLQTLYLSSLSNELTVNHSSATLTNACHGTQTLFNQLLHQPIQSRASTPPTRTFYDELIQAIVRGIVVGRIPDITQKMIYQPIEFNY